MVTSPLAHGTSYAGKRFPGKGKIDLPGFPIFATAVSSPANWSYCVFYSIAFDTFCQQVQRLAAGTAIDLSQGGYGIANRRRDIVLFSSGDSGAETTPWTQVISRRHSSHSFFTRGKRRRPSPELYSAEWIRAERIEAPPVF